MDEWAARERGPGGAGQQGIRGLRPKNALPTAGRFVGLRCFVVTRLTPQLLHNRNRPALEEAGASSVLCRASSASVWRVLAAAPAAPAPPPSVAQLASALIDHFGSLCLGISRPCSFWA